MTWKDHPTSAKIFIVVGAALFVLNLADFFFYDRQTHDLISGIGFGLWAYGTFRNGNRKRPEAPDPSFSESGYIASAAGLILVLAGFAMWFWV